MIAVSTSVCSYPTNSDGGPGRAVTTRPPPRARDLAVLCHALLEVVLVHGNPPLERELAGQLERKAVGRGQIERLLAGDGAARGDLLEELHPARQRLGETLFLGAQHVTDPLAILRAAPGTSRPSGRPRCR